MKDVSGVEFRVSTETETGKSIQLNLASINVNGVSKEAYHLNIKDETIEIIGSDAAGVFYGIQSLLSLIPLEAHQNTQKSISLNRVIVKDSPRFGFRGLHTDLGRNFQDKETILRILDIVSFYKINRYLFYMTEDEGWRLEIPGLPELTDVGWAA